MDEAADRRRKGRASREGGTKGSLTQPKPKGKGKGTRKRRELGSIALTMSIVGMGIIWTVLPQAPRKVATFCVQESLVVADDMPRFGNLVKGMGWRLFATVYAQNAS